jgi:hypothetical protein
MSRIRSEDRNRGRIDLVYSHSEHRVGAALWCHDVGTTGTIGGLREFPAVPVVAIPTQ